MNLERVGVSGDDDVTVVAVGTPALREVEGVAPVSYFPCIGSKRLVSET